MSAAGAFRQAFAPEAVDPVGDRQVVRPRRRDGSPGRRGPRRARLARSASGSTATWLTDATRCTTPSGVMALLVAELGRVRARRSRAWSRKALSRQSSWSRHGARFSTRSMIDHTSSTQATLRSRAFQTRPTRAARPDDAGELRPIARSWSNQCHACATAIASSDASRNGSASAVPAMQRHAGHAPSERRAHPGDGLGRDQVGAGRARAAGSACRYRPRGRRRGGRARCAVLDEPGDRVGRIRRPRRLVVGRITEPRRRNLVNHAILRRGRSCDAPSGERDSLRAR